MRSKTIDDHLVEAMEKAQEFEKSRANPSGIQPLDLKVLVHLDPPEETTRSGIVMSTGEQTERDAMAQVKGTIVALGHRAFFDWAKDGKPAVGTRVMIAKHAGLICRGADQTDERERPRYRLLNDKDISAALFKE